MYITIKYTVYLIVTFKLIRKNMNESCFVAEMLLRMCNDAYLCYVQCARMVVVDIMGVNALTH